VCGNTKEVVKIFEEHKPVINNGEDRSEWTEEQWEQDKKKDIERKDLIKSLAIKKVEDKEKIQKFFNRLDEHRKEFKLALEKVMLGHLRRLAKKSGLSDLEFDRFMIVQNANKANVHWRIGMHKNEKRKAFKSLVASWKVVKSKVLDGCDEKEEEKFRKFFAVVEADFKSREHRRHRERRYRSRHSEEAEGVEHQRHHRRRHGCHKTQWKRDDDSEEDNINHRRHGDDHQYERIRHHRRYRHHNDGESGEERAYPRHHRRHHRHHSDDESDDNRPRYRSHRGESDEDDTAAPQRHHRRIYRVKQRDQDIMPLSIQML